MRMSKPKDYRLGDLQLKIMKILWERGPLSVAEVHAALAREDRLAYTTVATMLRKMEERGLVRHHSEDRRFIYRAAVSAETVTRNMADDIVDRLFEGSLADMVSHLLDTREVSRRELAQIEQLIARRKQWP
jgi:predicted transcriptional regulator